MEKIIKNKKAEFSAMNWVIAGILLSGIIALFVIQTQSLSNEYEVVNVTSDDFDNTFNKFDDNANVAKDMWNKTTGEGGLSTVGSLVLLFKSTTSVIGLIFNSVTLVTSQMFGFTEYFGIPSQVGFIFFTILLSIVMVIIVFRIINSLNRRDL